MSNDAAKQTKKQIEADLFFSALNSTVALLAGVWVVEHWPWAFLATFLASVVIEVALKGMLKKEEGEG
jgi:hypothetical protein